jgi:hypothetical protein
MSASSGYIRGPEAARITSTGLIGKEEESTRARRPAPCTVSTWIFIRVTCVGDCDWRSSGQSLEVAQGQRRIGTHEAGRRPLMDAELIVLLPVKIHSANGNGLIKLIVTLDQTGGKKARCRTGRSRIKFDVTSTMCYLRSL